LPSNEGNRREREVDVDLGQISAAQRDMVMAATLEDDRRKALERHAVGRFWNAIGMAREPGERVPGVRLWGGE
jgi:hypothetical protein